MEDVKSGLSTDTMACGGSPVVLDLAAEDDEVVGEAGSGQKASAPHTQKWSQARQKIRARLDMILCVLQGGQRKQYGVAVTKQRELLEIFSLLMSWLLFVGCG